MKKVLATLTITLDTDSLGSSGTFSNDGKDFQMLIKTEGGKPHSLDNPSDYDFRIGSLKTLQTVIAHELGHFVSIITKDETHDLDKMRMYQIFQEPDLILPAERKAWKIAHLIYPDLDTENEKASLKTYES